MAEKTVDARGMLCPKPLILVKQTITGMLPGDVLIVRLDNETACENVTRFLADNGAPPVAERGAGLFTLRATLSRPPAATATPPEAYCAPGSRPNPPVVAVTKNGMGHGSDDLGRLLIQACINALKEVQPQPSAIVFYNGGAHLVCEGSPVLPALEELERRGVKLLVCGTCLDFFALKAARKVGTVSNMYEILTTLASAGHVIYP